MAQVTGPGQIFELVEGEVRGVKMPVFKNAPPSLRELFASARTRGDRDFLVYEDERWSFDEVMRHVDGLGAALVDHFGVQEGRPRRHRHAQLPRVGDLLRRHRVRRRHLGLAELVVDRGRARLRAGGLRRDGAHRGSRARPAQRGERQAPRLPHPRCAPRRQDDWRCRALRGCRRAGNAGPRRRHRARRRRHHPLHVRHDRPAEGRGVDARRDRPVDARASAAAPPSTGCASPP